VKSKKPNLEEIVQSMLDNFGTPENIFHPDYGWVLRNGEITPEGVPYFKELEQFYRKENQKKDES
jgi:hypothetical protein